MKIFISALLLISASVQLTSSQLQYTWDYIQYEDLPRPENTVIDGSAYYNKENVFMTGIAYDSRTNFMCAGFPSLKPSNPVRIGCFDTKKYAPGSSPLFKPFPSYRDNDLSGWNEANAVSGRSSSRNVTNAFSDEDYYVQQVEVSGETERALSHFLGNDQKVIYIYNNERPQKHHRRRRPRPPYKYSEEEEEIEYIPHPPPPPKRRRPPPREEYEYYSEEHNYGPHHSGHKKPSQPAQVIVIKDKDRKTAILEFLNKLGTRFNPLNVFGLNKKDDIVVYVDKPHQPYDSHEDHYDNRPRPQKGGKPIRPTPVQPPATTTTASTTIFRATPSATESATESTAPSGTTPSTTTSSTEATPELDPIFSQDPRVPDISTYLPPAQVAGIRRPAFLIKRPIAQDQPRFSQDYASFRSLAASSIEEMSDKDISRPYNFVSIHKPYFDSCGRLWFIDTGSLEYDEEPVFYKKPTLWAFDVKRNETTGELDSELYLKYEIPNSSYNGLRSMVVDIHGDCDYFHVYMPNQVDSEIVVFSNRKKTHWSFTHAILKPVNTGEPSILTGGQGVSSLALGQRDSRGFRPVFITIASSLAQYKVSSRLLRDSSSSPDEFHFLRFKVLGYKPTGEYTTSSAFDYKTGVLFMTTFPETTLNCWNSRKFLNPDSVGTLFSNNLSLNGRDVQIDREGNVLFLTNTFDSFTAAQSLREGTNFQVFKFDTKELVKGSICDPMKRDYRSLDGQEKSVEDMEEDQAQDPKVTATREVLPEAKVSPLAVEEEENVEEKSFIPVEIRVE